MKKIDTAEFRRAAKQSETPGLEERLQEGETAWFRGRPVPSPEGTIAIETDGGWSVTIPESEVVECAYADDTYFARVKVHANVVMKQEITKTLEPKRPHAPCDCKEEGGGRRAFRIGRRQVGLGSNGPIVIDPIDCFVCHYEWVVVPCRLPDGRFALCFELELVCEDVCGPDVVV